MDRVLLEEAAGQSLGRLLCLTSEAKWLDLLEQGDEIARAGLFSGAWVEESS